ncbi:ankyrin repeat domain-containing protein 20B-like [Neocloeon triangulifer]|uniref:ankyrin repeat domain-containing protein 20B-like n=1 Tax=Neocloeon triangulifer TaxID=2078957 RepID=UPI00286F9530|nr:ankyrin repeat domain-containing protein 20B-like [Neocloeon triangulifer]
MKRVISFVKGGGKGRSGASDVVPVRNLSLEGGLDDPPGYEVETKTLSKLHRAAWQGQLDKLKGRAEQLDTPDKGGRTALHLAAAQGHAEVVWFLISNRAKVNVRDNEGRTALLKAVECRRRECAQLLLERGADVNVPDNYGTTCLHLAATLGDVDLASALLRKSAALEAGNRGGERALHAAIRGNHREVADLLLRHGGDANSRDAEDRTPLMVASKVGSTALVALLLEYGADVGATDANGWTAEDYAVMAGHQAVTVELQRRAEAAPARRFEERPVDVVVGEKTSKFLQELESMQHYDCVPFEPEVDQPEPEAEVAVESPAHDIPGMPPSLKPPRSWELIQAGLTGPVTSLRPQSLSLANSPWDTPVGTPGEAPNGFLSLTRPKGDKKKPRPTSLPVTLVEALEKALPAKKEEEKEPEEKEAESSDWDSEDEFEEEEEEKGVDDGATLGREGTMQGREEIWQANETVEKSSDDEEEEDDDEDEDEEIEVEENTQETEELLKREDKSEESEVEKEAVVRRKEGCRAILPEFPTPIKVPNVQFTAREISLEDEPVAPPRKKKQRKPREDSFNEDDGFTKSAYAPLKRRLRAVVADRARVEQMAAALEEQNRRLQYELADALHAARTQRDVATELTRQLSKTQKGHAAALEDKLELQIRLRQADAELEYIRQLEQPPKELSRELTAEKERARRGVLTIRKLRTEVGALRARVLAAERRNTNREPDAALRKKLEELSLKVEEEKAHRTALEATIRELKEGGAVLTQLEKSRRAFEEERAARLALERDSVTRAELDKVRRSYEVALARAKQEAELAAREQLSSKLRRVNAFLEEQLQQQSRLEKLRCTSESQLREDFQQTRGKLLSELAKIQATLKSRGESVRLEEEQENKRRTPSPASSEESPRENTYYTKGYVPTLPLRPAAQVLSLLVPPLTSQNPHLGLNVLRKELEISIRQAAEEADRANPIMSEEEEMAQLKQKYLL